MIKVTGGLVIVGAVVVLGLTGCGSAGKVSDPPPSALASVEAAVKADASKAPQVAKIGGTVTYPEGVAVTVVSAGRFTLGEGARIGNDGKVGVKFPVKITNGSDKPLNLGLVSAHLHAGPNGAEGDIVFDSDNNVGGFSGTIAPGRVASANLGFTVLPADLGAVSIDVNVGFRDAALFEGTIK